MLIKGDPWKLNIPLIFGRFLILCDRNIAKSKRHSSVNIGDNYLNPIIYIGGITETFAKTLTHQELSYIATEFKLGLSFYNILRQIIDKPFIKEAESDINNSINTIFSNPPHYGQSKGSTLQFAEKTIKSYLRIKNISYPRSHILTDLSTLAIDNGLPILKPEYLQNIQCPAGVRYGEINVALNEAILSMQSAIQIFIIIGTEIIALR